MHHSWVEINLGELKRNVQALRSSIPAEVSILFVVKADAYGHGIEPVVKAAAEAGIDWFAVAYLNEALRVRRALPDVNILVMGVLDPEDILFAHKKQITPIVANLDHGLEMSAQARELGLVLNVHLKVDTGMGRLGVQWDDAEAAIVRLQQAGGLNLTGVCSHFSAVDPAEPAGAREQVRRFDHVLSLLPQGIFRHLSSSRAALYFPEWDYHGVRQGIVLYGYGATDPQGRFHTRPILQWKSRIVQVKPVPAGYRVGYVGTHTTEYPTHIAIVAVGYADGYNRALSNRGDVLVHGRRCAVVGRVSMNWIAIDLGPDLDAVPGDEVVLIGEQGGDAIWADELSRICRTIPYEILTHINPSIEHLYYD
jgi:alanine racemase